MVIIIFKVATVILVSVLIYYEYKQHWRGREGPPEEFEDNDAGYVPYRLVDAIAAERERVKNIEDLMSLIEAKMSEAEETGITVKFTDATGEHSFTAMAGDDLLDYLRCERAQIRKEISEKIRTISN